ncbi:coiled-coil domain-containing protein 152-like [Thalassophryne amazonica]|uniref:coiled-coil domain-containing protein 152-like n=1 Tax=Thalassophryne amazonica TaxID=390379 RepID=UPI001470DBA1|nr:coiled-coil domain-containing protein 152-like [Thalassophryne amazonica]
MIKLNCVSLDNFMKEFTLIEQKITGMNAKNNMLEIMLEDVNRVLKFSQNKEKSLIEERDGLLVTVSRLHQTVQDQCNLRAENERLKKDVADLKRQNDKIAEDKQAEIQLLLNDMRAEEQSHRRVLETLKEQSRREVEESRREALNWLEDKDAEVKQLLEKKDADLEVIKKRLKEQERERQSELLKLQMEFGAKLARVENTAQWNHQQQQQQQHGSNLLPQNVFRRKLQFFQEEKNKEIVALRQRIKELEENQRVNSLSDNRLKKRKI